MSMIWEPIGEAARERGWRYVAGEVASLAGCMALAIGLLLAAASLITTLGGTLCGR